MRIFHNVTEANRWYWKALLVSQLFPFLWAELHHIGTERCDLLQEFEKNLKKILRIQKRPAQNMNFVRATGIVYLIVDSMLLNQI